MTRTAERRVLSSRRRGVWIAPWVGEHDEVVLIAITSAGHLLCPPVEIPSGTDNSCAAEALWNALDRDDPVGLTGSRPGLRLVR